MSKQKGSRNERALVKILIAAGFKASRTPLSGAIRDPRYGQGHDIVVDLFDREHKIETKHHASGFLKLYRWLAPVDLLIVRANHEEPLVVMPLARLLEIAQAAKAAGKVEAKIETKAKS